MDLEEDALGVLFNWDRVAEESAARQGERRYQQEGRGQQGDARAEDCRGQVGRGGEGTHARPYSQVLCQRGGQVCARVVGGPALHPLGDDLGELPRQVGLSDVVVHAGLEAALAVLGHGAGRGRNDAQGASLPG